MQQNVRQVKCEIEKKSPIISIFESAEEKEFKTVPTSLKKLKLLCPYERYKLVKPFIEAQEIKRIENAKKDAEEQKIQPKEKICELEEIYRFEKKVKQVEEKKLQPKERTDEERLLDMKKHFMEATKNVSPELPPIDNKRKRDEYDDEDGDGEGKCEESHSQLYYRQPKKKTREWKMQRQLNAKANKRAKEKERFDYSQANFERFQGGAGSVQTGANVKSSFRGKVLLFFFAFLTLYFYGS